MKRGKLITFEGIEGVGKSTQLAFTRQHLERHQISVCLTREPGGTSVSERIRAILLDRQEPAMTAMTELLLMFAARNEHCARVIFPALGAGTWVISDRFNDASYAYQGGGRGLPAESIAILERLVLQNLRPDLTFLLDAPVEVALGRAAARRGEPDRFESERADFFTRARAAYLARARAEPMRFRILDATRAIDIVACDINAALDELVAK